MKPATSSSRKGTPKRRKATPEEKSSMLADSAVVVEELWWQGIDYARLNHSMISFFNFSKPEAAASRWSLVGKGLSKDSKAQKLAFQHWIEAKKAPFQKHREEEVKKKSKKLFCNDV
ncbi:hypothetical protein HYC85_017443 [Camellia sinensis]|uniref:Uncharacterized protein n=1 Tax=Camellia sinensis TaxID=4442 RepID=A0A7J7GV35_CAMSI|nr:hypothetical protein HYC85_017443 [Camellia sinensis]